MLARQLVSTVVALAFAVGAVAASAEEVRPLQGTVILVRAGADMTYIWDASAYVAQLVSDKVPTAEGMRALEATAVTALAAKAKDTKASSVTLKVVYPRTGAVSPVYKAATFVGVEHVCTISAPRGELVKDAASWAKSVAGGTVPAPLKIDVTGKLPEPQ